MNIEYTTAAKSSRTPIVPPAIIPALSPRVNLDAPETVGSCVFEEVGTAVVVRVVDTGIAVVEDATEGVTVPFGGLCWLTSMRLKAGLGINGVAFAS